MFEPLDENANELTVKEGQRIYLELSHKYPEQTMEHKDYILNSLCFALVLCMKLNVSSKDYPYFMQLVHKILSDNS